nr:hypothetical protein CFP56_33872 [Quercus suber]
MDSKQRTKKENHSLKTKAHAIHLCFLHAEPPPPPHRSLEQKELSPCRPLLAQTSTTPYTEAHRHRGRWSCAWSLETYRSRRDHNPKAMLANTEKVMKKTQDLDGELMSQLRDEPVDAS